MRQSFAQWIRRRANLQRRSNANSPMPSPRASDSDIDHYLDRVRQLLSIANQQANELVTERAHRLSVEQKLKESEKERDILEVNLRNVGREIELFKRTGEVPAVIELREQLNQIRDEYADAFEDEQARRVEAEEELKKSEEKLELLQNAPPSEKASINARVAHERDERRKAQKDYKKVKQQLRHANRSLNYLRRENSKRDKRSLRLSSQGMTPQHDLIGSVLPNLTLARDGASRLIRARSTKQVFDDLMRLNDSPFSVRSERVGAAEPWLEVRPSSTDRIYYRQEKGRSQYLVLIGDKNSQSNDIEWMKKNT